MSTTQLIARKTTRATLVVAFVIALALAAWLRSGPAESAGPAAAPNNERVGTLTFTGFSTATVDVRTFSFAATATPCSSGGGGCAGKPNLADPAITLDASSTSPLELKTLVTGSHVPKLTLVLFKPFTTQRVHEFVYEDATFTQLSIGASAPNTDDPGESLAWAFKKVTHKVYVPGTNTVVSQVCFDVAANVAC